ncbi:MAG TPA: bacillithiol transferase BstA [Bryobacteraceae bacterium]|nr:bacillithiol transferase BstA [Bryobacteraceae bacterium]
MDNDNLRFPVGRYAPPAAITPEDRAAWIAELESLPRKLTEAVRGLSDNQLDTPYRPGGWTVRQVVHHLPDSHLNSYVRFRLALTENSPTIKPYEEAAWAELPDAKSGPVEPSLSLTDALHRRWVSLLRSLRDEDFSRTFVHPEHGPIKLDWTLGLYAWHCRHHVAHIAELRKREGW